MQHIKRITGLICAVWLIVSGVPVMHANYKYTKPVTQYKYTYPEAQYKYTHPDAPYKYTYPDAPYKYTHPDAPYKYTYPDAPYKYTYPDAPYKYTYPDAPYKYTYPDAPYKYTYPDTPYKYTYPDAPYRYTHPDAPYKYTDLSKDPLYPNKGLGENATQSEQSTSSQLTSSQSTPVNQKLTQATSPYNDDKNSSASSPYSDINGHYAENHIIKLHELGIIDGYSDGSFKPDRPVTRAEMAKLVMKSAQIEILPEEYNKDLYFTDLDDWQAPYVNAAYSLEIVDGYSNYENNARVFLSNVNVNRAEGAKMVIASGGIQPGDIQSSSFIDVEGWMIPWIEVGRSIGVIKISQDMRFYPAHSLTRGAATVMISRMIDFQSQ